MSQSSFTRNRRHALMGATATVALVATALSLTSTASAVAGDIVGRVKDAASGASLAGVQVSTPSGRSVVTGRDGGYSLTGLAAGDMQVTAKYLSYKTDKQTIAVPETGAVSLDFALKGDNAVGEVVVTGHRLAQVRALNLQLNAVGVSNVVSADELGKFPDNNVADAVSRVPGVSVFHNRETGEGEYVVIRGLASDFNAFSVNGERVANTDNSSRQVSLTVLPPFGLQTVKVTKTSTPDMDGDAIAGTVDFRTPNAFDFNKPVLRLYGQYGVNEQASTQHEPSGGQTYQIDAGNVFGADKRFGVYVSGYYSNKDSVSEEAENDGEWTPYNYPASDQVHINYDTLKLPGLDLDYYRLKQQRYGGNVSFDYHGVNNQFYLRTQIAKFKKTDDHSELIVKNWKDNACGYYTSCDASGVYDPTSFFVDRNFNTNDEDSMLSNSSIGGESRFGRFKLTYDAFYSYGERNDPTGYGVEFQSPDSGLFTTSGVSFTNPDPRFPEWQLPAALQSLVYDNSQLTNLESFGRRTTFTEERKYGGRLDVVYDADGQFHLDTLKFGAKYLHQHQDHSEVAYTVAKPDYASLASSGLTGKQIGSILHGYYTFGSTISRDALIRAVDAATTGVAEDPTSASHYQEDIFAEYGMATFKFGKLEAITGVRIETTKVDNSAYNTGETCDDNGDCTTDPTKSGMLATRRTYTEVLPSLFLNYRANAHTVYRGAIWTSFSRPAYQNISGASTITRDASGNITSISQGNPDLKPAESLNFDASAEYYLGNAGLISGGVFYKDIKNFIFSNGDTVDGTTGKDVSVSQPMNGEKAHVLGVEVNFQRRFSELPGIWGGFGIEANATWLESRAKGGKAYRLNYEIPLLDSPKWLYNISLNYQKYGLDMNLAYNYQGKFIEDIRDNFIDKWNQPYKRMDFHSRYNLKNGVSVGFDVQNLLNDYGYYTSKGPSAGYQKDYIEPGRTLLFNVAYSY
jgi:iron complex outermembrane recepter protein